MINEAEEEQEVIGYKIGFVIIGIVAVNVAINMGIILVVNVRRMIERW